MRQFLKIALAANPAKMKLVLLHDSDDTLLSREISEARGQHGLIIVSDKPETVSRYREMYCELGVHNFFALGERKLYPQIFNNLSGHIDRVKSLLVSQCHLTSHGIELLDHIKYFLLNSELTTIEKYRLILAQLLEVHTPSEVVLDDYFCRVFCTKTDFFHVRKPGFRFITKGRYFAQFVSYALLSIVFQIVYKYLLSLGSKRRTRDNSRPEKVVVLGEAEMLSHLFDKMATAGVIGESFTYVRIPSRRANAKRAITKFDDRDCPSLYHFTGFGEVLVAIGRSLAGSFKIIRATMIDGFDLRSNENILIVKNLLQQFPSVVLGLENAGALLRRVGQEEVFFANANNWPICAINDFYQRKGIQTASYAHGLVENPFGYLSDTDRFYVETQVDKKVLERYNSKSTISIYSRTTDDAVGSQAKVTESIVFTTSAAWNSYTSQRFDFLEVNFKALIALGARLRFRDIVIKPHPYENVKDIEHEVEVLRAALPQLDEWFTIRLWNGTLSEILSLSNFYLTMYSTVITEYDALRMKYLVYDCKDVDLSSWYGYLPESIVYKDEVNLVTLLEREFQPHQRGGAR